jgi:hypothetical protein
MTNNNDDAAMRRKYPRHNIDGPIQVVDKISQKMIGVVANLSLEGLMLAGSEALEPERLYQLSLLFPHDIDGLAAIDIAVDCLWNNKTGVQSELCWSGCHIIDCSDADMEVLSKIIVNYSYG